MQKPFERKSRSNKGTLERLAHGSALRKENSAIGLGGLSVSCPSSARLLLNEEQPAHMFLGRTLGFFFSLRI
jgi:hypothetical protein